MKNFILDTSAIFTLIENETGVEIVENLLLNAAKGKIRIYISSVSLIELYYITFQEQGKSMADERLRLIQNLLVQNKPLHSGMAEIIGTLKANHSMSFADCCIAGLAIIHKATLVHKDPEFEQIKDKLKQEPLPYKRR